MASRVQNIVINKGADFSANVVAYANGSVSTPIDLTFGTGSLAYTANADIRKSYYHANSTATFNVWIQEASTGVINLYLDSANTILMENGRHVYDVIIRHMMVTVQLEEVLIKKGTVTVSAVSLSIENHCPEEFKKMKHVVVNKTDELQAQNKQLSRGP